MSETYKRFPFEYDIPPVPPPATFSILTPDFGSSVSPESTNDTLFFTSTDGSIEITGSFEPDTLDFEVSSSVAFANIDYIADTTIATNDVVYISSNNRVSPAIANSSSTYKAIGFAMNGGISGATITVRVLGEVSGLSGLAANTRVFLSPSVAGGITTTVPSGASDYLIQLGIGRTSTILLLAIQILGRRAL